MPSITITKVTLDALPLGDQIVTVKWRLTSDPDVDGSYTTVTLSALVHPTGVFATPVVITGISTDTTYTVYITNNCSGTGFKKDYTTPLPACVVPTDITATTS